MRCDDALPLMYDLVDADADAGGGGDAGGGITRSDAVALATHLASCSECAATLREIRGREALYRETLGAVASTRRPDEIAESIWNDGAVPVRLSADRAPFAFALGSAAAAAIALAGTTDVWSPRLIGGLDSAASALAGPGAAVASTLPQAGDAAARMWEPARAILASTATLASTSGLALGILGAIALIQVAGSAWLLGLRSARGRGPGPGVAS